MLDHKWAAWEKKENVMAYEIVCESEAKRYRSDCSSVLTKTCEIWGISYECGKITPWWVIWPLNIIGILILVIAVIGILNVINGKAKELPIINKIKIIKN